MEPTRVIQVDSDICYMDTRAIGPFGVSGVYVLKGDGMTLIEAGTSLTAPHILETLRQMGSQEDLGYPCPPGSCRSRRMVGEAGSTGGGIRA